jgi:tellurite methyltransferase
VAAGRAPRGFSGAWVLGATPMRAAPSPAGTLSMAEVAAPDPASTFVREWARTLLPTVPAPRRALDAAMGGGRHARTLAATGYRAFGVDRRFEAVEAGVRDARAHGLVVRGWCADLTRPCLPASFFSLVCVTRYLQRDLFPRLRDALVPGGVLLYETFTIKQRALGWGPTSAAHLLEPGELLTLLEGFDVLFSEEIEAPEAMARAVARRPGPDHAGRTGGKD